MYTTAHGVKNFSVRLSTSDLYNSWRYTSQISRQCALCQNQRLPNILALPEHSTSELYKQFELSCLHHVNTCDQLATLGITHFCNTDIIARCSASVTHKLYKRFTST